MNQLIEFVGQHPLLVSAFLAVATILVVSILKDLNSDDQVSPQDAVMLINRDDAVVVDIRSKEQFTKGHIIDAMNVPLADLAPDKLKKARNRPLIIVCETGQQSAAAAKKLENWPARIVRLKGGIAAWRTENLPIKREAA